ncbi:hypothetical protein [Bradyrhizobium sp. SYSU BS000235]|uniref:hypothetical protein n=1 Tax=Bradyrhizobium sp. SYSU BS000235 TaxID=3411332 RepID=UPI003C789E79
MKKSDETLIAEMSTVLRTLGTDLGDAREVIITLIKSRYLASDVDRLFEAVIERARIDMVADARLEHVG